jgi:hypothetical protein
MMLTKTKMIVAAIAMLGAASAAQASGDSDRDLETGGQVQTWQDIAHSKQLVQQEAAGGPSAFASTKPSHVHVKPIHHAN